jgi:macrolide-specific efflux system membrane fusion protein
MRILICLLFVLSPLPAFAIELSGIAEFEHRLTLNSSISGRVERIHVSVGQTVAAGDPLVSLVSTGLQAQVDIARAEAEALAPEVEQMQTELDKAQELYDRDSLARVALERAQQNHRIAAAHLSAAEAKLTLAQFHLSQALILSPIDAIVLAISTFPGQYINTRVNDQTLLTVADNRSMSVRALLPVELYSSALLNIPAEVTYLKQSFRGRVVAIDRQVSMGANNHPAMIVQVLFSADGSLPAGLPVKISFSAD